jgi:ABC-type bacteriocin/lantibiotic exporter with double-glycine peptidase domain
MSRLLLRAVAGSALTAAGCSSYLGSARDFDPAELDREPGWKAARDVRPVRQEGRADCGPAALAMLLGAWEVQADPREIAATASEPEDGVRAGDLRDFARRRGLRAFLVEGELADLDRELSLGRPVLVGLLQPHVGGARTHYVVVAGLNPERGLVAMLDPARGWRGDDVGGFLREWEPAGRLALVAFRAPDCAFERGDP